ncbi:MAG: Ig-like domain-containing protein, partial [Verrucomicrobiota bacterium]
MTGITTGDVRNRGRREQGTNRYSRAGILLFLLLLVGAFAVWAPGASAHSSYFSNCTACHSAAGTSCNACHHHGPKNLQATPSKTTVAPGEQFTVTFNGGTQSGWIRALLYRNNVEVARSSGPSGMGGGSAFPITFTTTAPSTPGAYTYQAAWFGNMYDTGNTTPANHGEERAPSFTVTVSAPADTTPPTVSSTVPANGATNINPGTAIAVTFSEAVTNVTTSTFTLSGGGGAVPGTVTMNGAGTTATFQPSSALANSTTYTATVTTGVKDAAGNALASNYAWSFTTAAAADTTPPTVTSTNPANNANNVAVNSDITATFSENILPASVTTASFTVSGVTGTVSVSGATATFTPSSPLAYATNYTATITTAVTDLAGNHLAANRTWAFTTGAAPDSTPPTVSSTAPVNNATGVPLSSQVSATFSEPMKASTITTANFKVVQGTVGVPGTVTLNGSGTTATFKPSAALANGTTYTATITTGVQDAAGNAMASNYSWSFTTAAAADATPPAVTSVAPADGASNVAVNASLTANFSEAVDPLTVTGATFTLKNGPTSVAGSVSVNGATATFKPSSVLANSTTYTATVTTGVKDLAGNALASAYSWSFTTGAAADTTAPTVSATAPANNATGVSVTTAVTATFSEALDAATVTTATFSLKDSANAPVAGAVSCAGSTATFAPATLAPGTTYTATLSTGIKDPAGNAMAQEYSWTFTTEATVATSDSDGDGAVDSVDDYPNDDRIATVSEHRNHRKIKVDVSGTSGARLRNMATVTESDPSVNQTGKPAGYDFTYGLLGYNIEGIAPGSSVTVTLTYPDDLPAGSKVYQVTSAGFAELPGATVSGKTVTLRL